MLVHGEKDSRLAAWVWNDTVEWETFLIAADCIAGYWDHWRRITSKGFRSESPSVTISGGATNRIRLFMNRQRPQSRSVCCAGRESETPEIA